jgi:S-adenosylmethionine-diacylglycerol 3-amino-3-carboxypropyl transferase
MALRSGVAGGGLFSLLYRTNLVYNQCWEDPALDRAALALTPSDRVLAITSAGCNVLDYALLGARVVAVDANPRQNHLLELKLAGIRTLRYDDFFDLFGGGGSRRAAALYPVLRPELSEAAQACWDRAFLSFHPQRTRGGSFYYAGTAGLFALAIRRYIEILGVRRAVDRVLAAGTIDEQREIYQGDVRRRLFGDRVLRLIGSTGVMSLLGVPEPQRRLLLTSEGGVVGYLRACLDHVLGVALLRENYFWAVYLNGRYEREACPEYLKRENFDRLRAGLVDNISIRTMTVSQALATDEEPFTAFVLLDHMDWLVRRPWLLEEEWTLIFARAAQGARVIFRSGARDASFLPVEAVRRLAFDHERAHELHLRDRVGTYGSFHVARIA